MEHLTEKFVKAAGQVIRQSERNMPAQVNSFRGIALIVWTIISLAFINRMNTFVQAYAAGIMQYIIFAIIAAVCFKGISAYFESPFRLQSMPRFIGKKMDVLFIYPFLLLSIINILNKVMETAGILPQDFQHAPQAGMTTAFITMRFIMLPIVALAEELFNLIAVSLIYKHLTPFNKLRLPISITAAAALFGFLHSFAWGGQAVVPLAISFAPTFIVTLYTGNIWISTLAHLYNDIAANAGMLGEGYSYAAAALLAAVPAAWASASLLKACFKKNY